MTYPKQRPFDYRRYQIRRGWIGPDWNNRRLGNGAMPAEAGASSSPQDTLQSLDCSKKSVGIRLKQHSNLIELGAGVSCPHFTGRRFNGSCEF